MTATAPSVLASARTIVEPELRTCVARLDEDMRRVSAYHFGWVDADGVPSGGCGKLLRPALVLLSARAAGHNESQVVTAAAAVELVHNFSLLHDDVMDEDVSRRHRPTAWTVFGRPAALLAGDALLALATDVLLAHPAPQAPVATRALSAATQQLITGQSADLSFKSRGEVTVQDCLAMSACKTGALLACACSIGATFVGAPSRLVTELHAFGAELGLAFQLVDDLLDLWGDPSVTGKPVLADVRARKKTIPVAHALTSSTAAGAALRELYAQPEPFDEDQVQAAADLVAQAGSREWTQQECSRRLSNAQLHLQRAGCPGPTEGLFELAEFIVWRQR